jgi:hypothetical protein
MGQHTLPDILQATLEEATRGTEGEETGESQLPHVCPPARALRKYIILVCFIFTAKAEPGRYIPRPLPSLPT